MSRTSTLPKRLQPMLATLTDAPFDDPGWVFEDKYDGFRMIAEIRRGKVALYSRNGKIISRSYMEVAKALEGVKGDAVIDGELVAIGKDGVLHFQLLQNALRREAKLLYCAFDLMFENAVDLRKQPLLERKKRLKAILPRDKLIAFSPHRKGNGAKFFSEAERKGLEGIMAKRADSAYTSGSRTLDWLKIKTAKRQEVVIAGFTAPRRTRPFFGALVLAVREDDAWRRSRYADIEAYTCVARRERRQRVLLSYSSLAAFLDQRSSQGRDRWRYSFRRPQRISWCWSVSPCHHMRRRGSRIVNSGNAPTSLGGTGSPSIASMPFRSRN